ncbi:hypothetical protein [Hydrogenophaga sp.]|uniref:hypothetical protein n=1 Tax=Hydrogenophaga sp. TaxID=1904254 RepID=UPI00271CA38E|nr:hypothetical protein [Hydrogenophaga sp.]MDO9438097.1 hypothetical protein [Hydrogenophaga sp.]
MSKATLTSPFQEPLNLGNSGPLGKSQALTDEGLTIGGRSVSVATPTSAATSGSVALPNTQAPPRPTRPAPDFRRQAPAQVVGGLAHHPTLRSTSVATPSTPRRSSEPPVVADRKPHEVAEEHMSKLFEALGAGEDGDVLASSKNFSTALAPLNHNASEGDIVACLTYEARLQTRLEEMPSATLDTLRKGAAVFLETTTDAVVGLLHGAIQVELARREEVLLSADLHMAQFFTVLVSGNLSDMQSFTEKFTEALLQLKKFDPACEDRWLMYLNKCSVAALGAVGPAVRDLVESPGARVDESVLLYLEATANHVLLERMGAAFKATDEHMATVLDALALGNASNVTTSIQAFEVTVGCEFPHFKEDMFSFKNSSDPRHPYANEVDERLQGQLRSMTLDQLTHIRLTVVPHAGKEDAVVARIKSSAAAEDARRQTSDDGQKGANSARSSMDVPARGMADVHTESSSNGVGNSSSSSRTPAPLRTGPGVIRRTFTNLSSWWRPTEYGRTARIPLMTVPAADDGDIQNPLASADIPPPK